MGAYGTILVGTDGSASSFRAVTKAGRLAGDTGAKLVLACAYAPMRERDRAEAADRLGDLAYKISGSTPAEDALRAAREHALAGASEDARAGMEIEEVAVAGDAVDMLAKLARDRGADLMVVGNRGLNSLAGRILGSVPANLSHRSPCDILIVHTTDGR